MVGPVIESRDRDNRRLKRLLAERWGVEGEEDILLNHVAKKRIKTKPKVQEYSEEEDEDMQEEEPVVQHHS